jgi:hypothetical protein
MPTPDPFPATVPEPVPDPVADPVAGPHRWSGFDTLAHHTAQDACHHLIHCAVDATTRRLVVQALDCARTVGDIAAVPLLLAQLTGPCCLPPQPPPPAEPTPAP